MAIFHLGNVGKIHLDSYSKDRQPSNHRPAYASGYLCPSLSSLSKAIQDRSFVKMGCVCAFSLMLRCASTLGYWLKVLFFGCLE